MLVNIKNQRTMLPLIAILALFIIGITYTYSRYLTTITGQGTAKIAKWNIVVKNNGVPVSNTFTFNFLCYNYHDGR